MTLNERSEVKSYITVTMISYMMVIHIWSLQAILEPKVTGQMYTTGFLDHEFLYDGNTYWVSTGNNKGDIA